MITRRFVLALLLLATPVFAKDLHWRTIDVDAQVEADGDIHVVERQAIVFNGDWNGGERDFNLRPRQKLALNSVKKIDGGVETPLTQGSLDAVDHYDFASKGVVRWRSRLPTDPPFENRELTYVLDYTLANALVPLGGTGYRIDHDFGLPNRAGVIEQFNLRLTFDPVWTPSDPVTMSRAAQQPGQSAIVTRDLTYTGSGAPGGIQQPTSFWVGLGILGALAAAFVVILVSFYAAEQRVGRFAPIAASRAPVDEVLRIPAEVAGAAWDGTVGAPEVSATLARMTQEKKIATRAEHDVLHISMIKDRQELDGHERRLIADLFPTGGTKTNTEEVKAYYRSRGFNPADSIKDGVEEELGKLAEWKTKTKRFLPAKYLIGFPLALAGLALAAMRDDNALPTAIAGGFFVLFFGIIASGVAASQAKNVTSVKGAVIGTLVPSVIMMAPIVLSAMFATEWSLRLPELVALLVWTLVWLSLVFDLLRTRDTPSKIALRKRIASVRAYFAEELKKPNPDMRDEWFPYLLAFGLGKNADRWFRAHGAPSSGGTSGWSSSSSSSSYSSSSSPSGWTGGGGAFGGAGATGGWAMAAGAMAAGVAAPSSSGSGGSSSGGGGSSSSGGGGGGGW